MMGSLTPGATLIYERVGNTVYAREFGKSERKEIGYTYNNKIQPDSYFENVLRKYNLELEWAPILKAAEDNPTLQEAIDRVKILYHLSKDHE